MIVSNLIGIFIMSVNLNFNHKQNHLNYEITVPKHIKIDPIQKSSSVSPAKPRIHAKADLFDGFKKCCEFIKKYFQSWFSPLPSEINDDAIHRRLINQMAHAERQMRAEPAKAFRPALAPPNWISHEERVGNLAVGVCHAQGRRPTMEDEHLAVQFNLQIGGRNYPVQLFGVFDGHGGPAASRYIRDHLREKLSEALRECNPTGLTEAGIWRALKIAFVRLDRDFGTAHPGVADDQGSTATVAMVLDGKLWTANVGDSRTVLDNAGTPVQLTEDAKPGDARYKKNIEKRGGAVVDVGGVPRINRRLAVGRAIGDHALSRAINPRPKITVKPLSEIRAGSHLILCCDGIYDVAKTTDIVANVHVHRFFTASTLARNIVYSAYQSGSTDNLSALVVKIR
jgi:protein phosphatase 1L